MLPIALELIVKKASNHSFSHFYHNRSLSSGPLLNFHDYDTLLISFGSESDMKIRDNVYNLLLKQPSLNIKQSLSLKFVQQQWISGNVSNFDYLMFLNQQSGRSFNDLTQYPVFPWIITDYESDHIDLENPNIYRDLSKPVGALNPSRLKKILQRYREMPADNKFMYGSHYSTPGYSFVMYCLRPVCKCDFHIHPCFIFLLSLSTSAMYYLVRAYPEYMLRFQNGKFDASDRLFSSISRTWESAYQSLTDVKELIPQFYDGDGAFLLNTNNLNLGVRSDKKEVHDVELPKLRSNLFSVHIS